MSVTKDLRILFDGKRPLFPLGFTDFDWGGCFTNRNSTSGFEFLMVGGAVSCKSKKQGCVVQ